MAHHNIVICRVYEPPKNKQGIWILVDRLWPRGLKKEALAFDFWLKEIAPSPALRQWFHHDPTQWEDFSRHYVKELASKKELIESVKKMMEKSPVTLFYAAKDPLHNHALVLQATLNSWPALPEIK
jgi:uncharacterized protein YeaO (DUF488 family)